MVSGKNGYGIYSLNQVTFRWDTYEPHRDNTNKMACAPSEDSDQPGPGRGSSIGSEFAWHASSPEFDPHVRHILSWRLGHENISTAILPLPLIQEEQLSVTGERMCTKYW